jgi:DNA end-binding protein Ku
MHFKLLDKRNRSEVRYERVPWDQIVKGYKQDGGDYVLLTDEDFKKAAVEATQTIEIEDFVNLAAIEYKYFEKPYYVVPGKMADKGFVILREVLKRTGKVGIGKVVIHTRQYLSALIPQGNFLVLNILRYYQELRDPAEFKFPAGSIEDYKVTERELQIAEMLVDNMTSEWDPRKYHDEYREALMEWIQKKAQAGEGMPPAQEVAEGREEGKVIDMMELLKRSVQQAAMKRGNEKKPAKDGESGGEAAEGR